MCAMPKGKKIPKTIRRILVLPAGENEFHLGDETRTGIVDASAALSAIEAFNEQGVDLPIDFDHATLDDSRPPNAMGWIKSLEYQSDVGLMAHVELSDEANSRIHSGAVKYVSPVAMFDKKTRRLVRLHSLALTNKPATKNMPDILEYAANVGMKVADNEYLIAACMDYQSDNRMSQAANTLRSAANLMEDVASLLRSRGVQIPEDQTPEETWNMAMEFLGQLFDYVRDYKGEETTMATDRTTDGPIDSGVLEKLAARLGIGADANEDDFIIAVEKLKMAGARTTEVLALSEQVKTLQLKLDSYEIAATEKRINEKIDRAVSDGKLSRYNAEGRKTLAEFYRLSEEKADAYVAAMPVLIAHGRITPHTTADTGNSRESIIIASAKNFRDNDLGRRNLRLDAHVNGSLRNSGMNPLTREELARIEKE